MNNSYILRDILGNLYLDDLENAAFVSKVWMELASMLAKSRGLNIRNEAIERTLPECLKYAVSAGIGRFDDNTSMIAARLGHLDILRFCHENGCPWDVYTCYNAARYGNLECLQYAHENSCPWDICTILGAAQGGHMDRLKYAIENGCPLDEPKKVVPYGLIRCHRPYYDNRRICVCPKELHNDQIACLKYAYQKGCNIRFLMCLCAYKLTRIDLD